MPNNFKIAPGTGSDYLYLSNSAGNDGNTGQDPDNPKSTLSIATSIPNVIIGSGTYNGALSIASDTVYIDGSTVLLLTDDMPFRTGSGVMVFNETQSYFEVNGGGFSLDFNIPGTSRTYNINHVVLKNLNIDVFGTTAAGSANIRFNKSVINNGFLIQNSNPLRCNYNHCVILSDLFVQDTIAIDAFRVKNSYLGTGYNIDFGNVVPDFENCCVNGTITYLGTQYDLKQDKNGDPVNGSSGFADIVTVYPNVYVNGNFSQDAEFFNLTKGDFFNVATTSPLIRSASDNGNIGNVRGATRLLFATDPELATPVQSEDIVLSGGDLIYDISGLDGVGTITSQPIQVATIAQELGKNFFTSNYRFDTDEPIGSINNINVLAKEIYTISQAGRNPQRLTFEMRWAIQDAEPTLDADWDNQGSVTAGDFSVFEVNTKPTIDSLGRGNGDPEYSVNNGSAILAKWIQFRISINEGA